ncbi:MAG: RICIN domain-containing protein [Limisphaerales bacterium]
MKTSLKQSLKLLPAGGVAAAILLMLFRALPAAAETNGVSATPAMGWSTWSFLRQHPTEASVEAQALAMHNSGLQNHGFIYINLDDFYYYNPATTVDAYGRWVVSSNTFPDGMAAVAAYVHSLGLKFGIYVTAGIPVAAYKQNTPILGTTYHAQDIVTNTSTYEVNYNYGDNCMYYIDYNKPGAQAFMNSWADLFASWGVDYLKIDGVGDGDINDIEAWSQALVQSGRPIHLELSNSLDVNNGRIWEEYANGWRIEGDIECYCSGTSYPLTDWNNVLNRFKDAPHWTQFGGPGGWNDLDSLEVGNGTNNDGLTTSQEQAMMTLWSICCAPLILGVDLTQLNTNDTPMLFNNNVLQIDQDGSIGAPLAYNTTTQIWRATETDGTYAVAFFNLGSATTNISVTWAQLGFTNAAEVQDLWAGTDLGRQTNGYTASVPPDSATFYRIAPVFPAFRYLADAPANVLAGGATLAESPELSAGLIVGYVGEGGTLTFNNVMAPTSGTYNVTFFYENGDPSRNADISINGGSATALAFVTSGGWNVLASETITVPLQPGSNSIAISNPTAYAPNFDSLVVQSVAPAPPLAPTGLAATGGLSQAALSWLVSSGAGGYVVEYGQASGSYTATNTTATAGLTVAGLTNGAEYYFVVSATNLAGASANSSEASAWIGAPAPPTNLVATAGNAQASLQWSPSLNATSYNLKRSTTNGGSYTTIVNAAATNYTDTSVMNAVTYYYVVSALNGSVESSNSPPVSVTPDLRNGTYKIISQDSGLALDDPNGGGAGAGADQQPYGGTNQQWTIVSVVGGVYKITAANGFALSGPNPKAQLVLSSYTGAADQLWTFQASGSAVILQNDGSGQVMDDFNLSTTPGTVIGQWPIDGGLNQNWLLTPIPLLACQPPGVSNGNLILTGTGGAPNGGYTWLATTNLAVPLADWTINMTGNFDGSGSFSNAIPISSFPQAQFFLLRSP